MLFLLAALGLGCDASSKETDLNKPIDDLGQMVRQLKESLGKVTPPDLKLEESATGLKENASAEMEKLFRLEYRVVEIKNGSSSEIEQQLTALGNDRWDCFHAESSRNALLFFCKRAPKTYLRYLLKMF